MEIESKFEILVLENVELIVQVLVRYGFKRINQITQNDIYWDDSNYSITNLKRGLRARSVDGDIQNVEFKSLFKNEKGQQIVEEISLLKENQYLDVEAISEILTNRLGMKNIEKLSGNMTMSATFNAYGLKPQIYLNKRRTMYIDDRSNIEACIDRIDGISPHLEIELIGKDQERYYELVSLLQEQMGHAVRKVDKGYLDMIAESNKKICSSHEFDLRFKNNPDWNVLPNERKLVINLFKKLE